MKYIIAVIIIVLVCTGIFVLLFDVGRGGAPDLLIKSFDDCAAHYPIMESFPRRCITPYGELFTEAPSSDQDSTTTPPTKPVTGSSPLHFSNLEPRQLVSSPLTIYGQAPGTWYFEASFPVVLVDEKGKEIAHSVAQAQSDWMTTADVPFTAEITFTTKAKKGILIFKKDNPSGLPQNDASTTVPVIFVTQ